MFKKSIFLLLLVFITVFSSRGESVVDRSQQIDWLMKQSLYNFDTHRFTQVSDEDSLPSVEEQPTQPKKYKSPALAFLFSAVIPGTGELYADAKRGYFFMGIEALAWSTYYLLRSDGLKKKEEYMDFGDANYDSLQFERYREYYRDNYTDFCTTYYDFDNDEWIEGYELPPKGTSEFYDRIGTLDQYIFGWEDFDTRQEWVGGGNMYCEYREIFRNMKSEANKQLKRTIWCMGISLFNHTISAISASAAARFYNKRVNSEQSNTTLKLRFHTDYNNQLYTTLSISQRF